MRLFFVLLILGGLILSCSKSVPASMSPDEKAIREARAFFNKAIAEHDTVLIDETWMDNFTVISSRDHTAEGRQANRQLFVHEFLSKPDVIYIRTPKEISIMPQWGMASETGTWEGSWTDTGNKIEIEGTYYAKWHMTEGKWLLRIEVYTPTYCEGGPYCDNRPVN